LNEAAVADFHLVASDAGVDLEADVGVVAASGGPVGVLAYLYSWQPGEVVALVSDAGTPLVSDPGSRLVSALIERGHEVVAVPGASALLTAPSYVVGSKYFSPIR
jgi:hypothetical protein